MGVTMNSIKNLIEDKIQELAELEGKVQATESIANSAISKINARVESETRSEKEKIASLRKSIYELANSHKEQLFPDKKVLKLSYGEVGFKLNPESLVIEDEEKALVKLKKMKRLDCIIVKETINKNVVKKDAKVMKSIKAWLNQDERFILNVTPITITPSKVKFKVS